MATACKVLPPTNQSMMAHNVLSPAQSRQAPPARKMSVVLCKYTLGQTDGCATSSGWHAKWLVRPCYSDMWNGQPKMTDGARDSAVSEAPTI